MFEEFSEIRKAQWLEQVVKDLKGKPLSSLDWEADGLHFSPFFHADDRQQHFSPLPREGDDNQWEAGEYIRVKDVSEANRLALSALERGAQALCFELEAVPAYTALRQMLAGVQHEWISTHFVWGAAQWDEGVFDFVKLLEEKGQDPAKVSCSFQSASHEMTLAPEDFRRAVAALPQARLHCLRFSIGSQQAAHTTHELARALSGAHQLLLHIQQHALPMPASLHSLQFSCQLSDHFYLNLGSIRALRLLWQQLLQAWEIQAALPPPIEAHIGPQTQTEDEHYNKIKATNQALAAVLAGVNRLYVHPSDAFSGQSSDFNRRIALNLQLIMQHESHLGRVQDPAAGSYFFDTFTETLAETAWNKFRQMV